MKLKEALAIHPLMESYKELKPAYDYYKTKDPYGEFGSEYREALENIKQQERSLKIRYGFDHPVDAFEHIIKTNIYRGAPPNKNTYNWIKQFKQNGIYALGSFMFLIVSTLDAAGQRKIQTNKGKDYDIIFKTQNVLIIEPNTKESAQRMGYGTKWCTTSRDPGNRWYERYREDGRLFYITASNVPSPYNKMAVLVGDGVLTVFDTMSQETPQIALQMAITKSGEDARSVISKMGMRFVEYRNEDPDDVQFYADEIGIDNPLNRKQDSYDDDDDDFNLTWQEIDDVDDDYVYM